MITRCELLRRLADGSWHRGPDLAEGLGISRAAVGKAVAALRSRGVSIESGRAGYRLADLPPTATNVVNRLGPRARGRLSSLQTLHCVDSTNSWLLRRRMAGNATGSRVCIAARQTGGRGRLNRDWESPSGAGLYLSLDLPCSGPPAPALALAVAVMTAEAIQPLGPGLQFKWPNDLILNGRKVGGILLESRGEYGGPWQLIVGLGLNVHHPRRQGRTSLKAEGYTAPSLEALAAAVLDQLLPDCPRAALDPRPWLPAWRQRDHFLGAQVRVAGPVERCEGRAAGVDDDGALLVHTPSGERRFIGGDVSLRGGDGLGH